MFKYLGSEMVNETKKAKFLPKVWLECIIFFGVFLVANIFQVIILLIGIVPVGFGLALWPNASSERVVTPIVMLLTLLATVGTVVAVFIYGRLIEKRNTVSMGLRRKKAGLHYLIGLGFGAVEFLLCFGGMYLFGMITDFRFNPNASWLILFLFFVCFLIQTFSEEYLCRGYLMNSISARSNVVTGVLVNSVVFGLLHILNPGITLVAIITLALTGVSMSLIAMVTDDIWASSGMHFFWNFAITCFLGDGLEGAEYISLFTIETNDRLLVDAGFFSIDVSTLFQLGATIILVLIPLGILLARNAKNKKAGVAPFERYVAPPKPTPVVYSPGYYPQPYAGPAAAYGYLPAAYAQQPYYLYPAAPHPAYMGHPAQGYAAYSAAPQGHDPATSHPLQQQYYYQQPLQHSPFAAYPQPTPAYVQHIPAYSPQHPAPVLYPHQAPTGTAQPQHSTPPHQQQQTAHHQQHHPMAAQPPAAHHHPSHRPAASQSPAAPNPEQLLATVDAISRAVATDKMGNPLESSPATPESCAPPPPQPAATATPTKAAQRGKTTFPKIHHSGNE